MSHENFIDHGCCRNRYPILRIAFFISCPENVGKSYHNSLRNQLLAAHNSQGRQFSTSRQMPENMSFDSVSVLRV
jgi:hypothetical protein